MARKITILALTAAVAATAACRRDNYVTFGGQEQGTTYTVTVNRPAEGLGERIDSLFDEVDNTFSMFNPRSLVSRVNRNETSEVTPLFASCFALAKKVHSDSDGYYDITVKPLVDIWGFGPGEAGGADDIAQALEYVGMDKIRIEDGRIVKDDPRVQLDFSSVAKGLTVDLIAEMLDREGVRDYMVWIGGEVRVRGVNASGKNWRIAVERPSHGPRPEIHTVTVPTAALPSVATSGNYRNWFVDGDGMTRSHTMNPKTGEMSHGNIVSVSIAARECAVADAYATGLLAAAWIEEAARILPPQGIEYYIIYYGEGGEVSVLRSEGFPESREK